MSTGSEESTTVQPEVKPKSGSKKFLIIGIVAVVVIAQLAVLYFFLAPAAKNEEKKVAEATPLTTEASEGDGALGELVEVTIGTEFNCTNGKAHEGSVIHVNFKVVALVASNQEAAFKDAVKAAEARIKEAVMVIARQADIEALNDPNLGSIKRLIREHINKILRKSFIQNIVISEYSLIER